MGSDTAPNRIIIQVAGSGHRIGRAALIEAMDRSPSLRALLIRYVQALNVQTVFTALSNAVHPIEERLARWLLMCHDRIDGDEIGLTHEFMSVMLAVRRPSVTTALHVLEGNHFIRSERGWVTICDRKGLEEFAQDAYGKPEAEYDRLIGSMRCHG
jgi:CRP-like cAMP-binding protein